MLYFLLFYILGIFLLQSFYWDLRIILPIYHRSFILILIVMVIYCMFLSRRKVRLRNKQFVNIVISSCLFIALNVFSVAFHENESVENCLSGMIAQFSVFVIAFLASLSNPTFMDKLKWPLVVILLTFLVVSLMGVIDAFRFSIYSKGSDAWKFLYNFASFFYIYSIPLILMMGIPQKYKIILIGMIMIIVLMSLKRGPLVAVIGSLSIFIGLYQKNIRSVCFYLFMALSISLSIYYLFPDLINPILDRFDTTDKDDISSNRFELWAIYVDYYLSGSIINQLMGFGTQSSLMSSIMSVFGKAFTPHNSYIMVIFYYGIIAFVVFLYWLFNIVRITMKYREPIRASLSLIFSFWLIAISAFYTPSIADSNYTSLICFFVLGVSLGKIENCLIQVNMEKRRKINPYANLTN